MRPTIIPPKALADLVTRAARNDGCVRHGDTYLFAAGNIVSVVTGPLDCAVGHVYRDPVKAAEIRNALEAK